MMLGLSSPVDPDLHQDKHRSDHYGLKQTNKLITYNTIDLFSPDKNKLIDTYFLIDYFLFCVSRNYPPP